MKKNYLGLVEVISDGEVVNFEIVESKEELLDFLTGSISDYSFETDCFEMLDDEAKEEVEEIYNKLVSKVIVWTIKNNKRYAKYQYVEDEIVVNFYKLAY